MNFWKDLLGEPFNIWFDWHHQEKNVMIINGAIYPDIGSYGRFHGRVGCTLFYRTSSNTLKNVIEDYLDESF